MMKSLYTLLLAGCLNCEIPRDQACHEQADAWCDIAAPTPGCAVVYEHWCGSQGVVDSQEQSSCLRAISTMSRTWDGTFAVPDRCQRTWQSSGK